MSGTLIVTCNRRISCYTYHTFQSRS